MEPDIVVELANNAGKHGAQISTLDGDNDSSTIKKVRESVQHDVDKWLDVVHAKRSLATSLYSLQAKHKGLLSNKVIDYLLNCFGYALKQNKDNIEGLKTSLKSIVPHAFAHHENCSSSWCGYLNNPSAYTHNSLPHAKGLQKGTRGQFCNYIEVIAHRLICIFSFHRFVLLHLNLSSKGQ